MKIVTGSRHVAADVAIALDVAGREHLVIAAKATWSIPEPGQRPRPLPPQALVQSDVYVGEPGLSPMLYGADFARFKPQCDVLFDASAHAPGGEAVTELLVAWQVGTLRKGLRVLGPRTWRSKLGFVTPGKPEPFVTRPLHYGLAFGGTFPAPKEGEADAYGDNPAGVGWAGSRAASALHDTAAPGLEAIEEPVRSPHRQYTPMAFSAIARHWSPRRDLAGTYDEAWQRDIFPLLPADYDEHFNQCAPPDQRTAYLRGGEPVVLRNMMAGRPDVRFALPRLEGQAVRVLRTDYSTEAVGAVADTLYFEPDQGRFSVVWRASTPIRRRLQEFDTVAIGPVDPQWWANISLGRQGGGCAGCGAEEAA